MVAMGFCFITAASTPVLCLKCSQAGVTVGHAVKSKGTPELLRLVAKGGDTMGHTRDAVKSDNEPALKALAGWVQELRTHSTDANAQWRTSQRLMGSLNIVSRR